MFFNHAFLFDKSQRVVCLQLIALLYGAKIKVKFLFFMIKLDFYPILPPLKTVYLLNIL
jgi:hypothetical protein